MLTREEAIVQLRDAIASIGRNDAERTRVLYARYAIEMDRTTLRKWRQGYIPNSAIIAAILITEYHEV
jgi:hypothetical protein